MEIAGWERVCKVCNVATIETNIIWQQICLELYIPIVTIYKLFMKSIGKKKDMLSCCTIVKKFKLGFGISSDFKN